MTIYSYRTLTTKIYKLIQLTMLSACLAISSKLAFWKFKDEAAGFFFSVFPKGAPIIFSSMVVNVDTKKRNNHILKQRDEH